MLATLVFSFQCCPLSAAFLWFVRIVRPGACPPASLFIPPPNSLPAHDHTSPVPATHFAVRHHCSARHPPLLAHHHDLPINALLFGRVFKVAGVAHPLASGQRLMYLDSASVLRQFPC